LSYFRCVLFLKHYRTLGMVIVNLPWYCVALPEGCICATKANQSRAVLITYRCISYQERERILIKTQIARCLDWH